MSHLRNCFWSVLLIMSTTATAVSQFLGFGPRFTNLSRNIASRIN